MSSLKNSMTRLFSSSCVSLQLYTLIKGNEPKTLTSSQGLGEHIVASMSGCTARATPLRTTLCRSTARSMNGGCCCK